MADDQKPKMVWGRRKRKDRPVKRPNRPVFAIMCVIAGILLALNGAIVGLLSPYFDIVTTFTSKPDTTSAEVQQASDATRDITEEVEGEAVVLLDNKNSGLPLAKGSKVNVFGSTVGDLSYGGTGSGSGDSSTNVTFYQGLENAGFEVNEDLESFYDENAVASEDKGVVGTDWNLYELPQSSYS